MRRPQGCYLLRATNPRALHVKCTGASPLIRSGRLVRCASCRALLQAAPAALRARGTCPPHMLPPYAPGRWAQSMGFSTRVIDKALGDEAGVKSVELEVEGLYA